MSDDDEESLRDQLVARQQEHRDLDSAIAALESAGSSDNLQIKRLKKKKLYLKDRISDVEDRMTPDIIA